MKSQIAPNVSYATPQNYLLNAAITTLTPVNSGGSVLALTYKQVSSFAGTTSGFLDGTGTATKMDGPLGMTMDDSGNIYFVDSANFRIRKMTPAGVVTTIAGDGYSFLFYGREKNNAVGSAASFNWPSGIVLDTANNCLYVTDKENDVIRKVSLTGTFAVTTFAGSGTSSSLDGSGTAATFKKPNGIAIDATNTYLYVTDRTGNKIRRITISDAQVLTIAGSGTASTVDNATGTSATFNEPTGIAVDANFIYVSDFGGNKIRKIALTAPYAVTTFAGSGATSSLDGTGVAATFDTPFGITLDGAGNLFVTEWGNKIRKITPTGIVTTIAGSGAASSVDGNGIAATFNNPSGIVINPATGIGYVSEYASDRIRKVELGGYAVSPVLPAGLSLNSSTGSITGTPTTINNGPLNYDITAYNYYGSSTATLAITTGTIPTLTTTAATALTQTTATTGGNVTANGGSTLLEKGICWSTSANPTILDTKVVNGTTTTGSYTAAITGLVASTTYNIRAYATNFFGTSYGTPEIFTTLINQPNINYTASNNFTVNTPITTLTVSNTGGTVSGLASANVSTLAGSTQGYANGSGTAAKFNTPRNVASDVSGTIYVSDSYNHAIRKISPTGLVSTFSGGNGYGNLDGQGISAQFKFPNGIAIDILGNVFVADGVGIRKIDTSGNVTTLLSNLNSSISFFNPIGIVLDNSGIIYFSDAKHRIYKIDTSNNLTVLAGGESLTGTDDGIGSAARFNEPNGLAIDAAGNVYVADTGNHRIRKIKPSGVVTTLAGSTLGFNDGTGASAQFFQPLGITVDATGNVYVVDSSNTRIRKITPSGVVTTIAGIASSGSMDGDATLASFNFPTGITSGSDGNLYIAELSNHRIRKIEMGQGFSISPALPAGLELNANGSISGTPTVATAATTYTVKATNAGGSSFFEVSIATLALPVITTTSARFITATALTTGGRVTSEAASVTAAGICYSTSPMPTLLDTFTTDVLSEGSFTRTIGNLTTLTTYYIRAYATNSVGTAYGNQIVVNTPMYAPIISYSSPSPFIVNTPITALGVSNIGGAIPTQLYGVSTVAGGNESGSADGPLGIALFSNPTAVVKDSQGNLFVADYYNHGIRKIAPNGIVSFYAGGGGPGSADGPSANSSFKNPFGLAIDHLDNLYVSEPLAHTIRKITASGIVSTFAGTSGELNSDPLSFNTPRGLTCDAAGNVYVIDSGNNRIQKITPDGITSTFFSGGDVQISYNMVFDSVGNLWLATESSEGGLKKIDTKGLVTSTLFGRTTKSIAIDQSDNIYTADQFAVINKITPSFAISNINRLSYGFADGDFDVAKFKGISGLYLDQEGLLYVADTDNNRIRLVSQFGYSVTPALPAGLVLNTDGSITGTPTVATTATNYTITGTNSGGSSSNRLNFAITTIPTLTTTAASAVIATSATAGGNVTSDGYTSVTERGVCWSTSPNPTIAGAKTTDGTGTGTFTSSITGLSALTTYYVRAYATNSVGTVYGNEIVINTPMYAPVISYSSPNAFVLNTPITALGVSNSGGTVSGLASTNVSTFAGSTQGYVNGNATDAKFYSPFDVTSDALGTIYVADTFNHAIRKISSSGVVTTLAGGFMAGNLDGTGINAQFSSPQGIATDILGNVFVANGGGIRKINASGNVTTLVTSPSSSISFFTPIGIVVDTSGIIYFLDTASRIYKIDTSNNLSVLAGGYYLTGTDDGIGTSARFNKPYGLALDATGNVYVADTDNHRIRKITPSGVVTTLAGSTLGFNDGTGASAKFSRPTGLAIDAAGNIYVAESGNNRIRKITPMGVVTTIAGIASAGSIDGSATLASFNNPVGITSDSDGNLYVSEIGNHKIRKITTSNGFSISPALPLGLALNVDGSITGTPTIATATTDYVVTATNTGGSSSKTLNFAITTIPSLTTTEASTITAITATLGGNVTSDGYASVTARGVCWSTSPNPTIADAKTTNGTGTGIFESAITGLSPVTAYYVRAYATNSVGTVYGNEFSFTTVLPLPIIQYSAAVTYAVNTAITPLAVSNTGGLVINSLAGVSTFAGSTAGYTDGTTNAQFSQPSGVVTDSNGNLFVADSSNNAIRKITPSGTVSTFAGGTSGTADGQGSAAQFLRPNSIAIDSNDNLYISDTGNHLIRKITASGLVSTLAGTAGTAGFVNGTGTSAQFNYPYGLTLDVSGNVYVADNVNNSIRKITPAGVVSTYFVVDYMLRTLDSPTAVAFDSSGNLFVSQASSNGLVKILIIDSYSELTNFDNNDPIGTITFDTNNTLYAAAGGFIVKAQEPYTSGTLFAGGSQGFADGALLEAKFGGIRGLTIDNEGVMYVADGVNNRIRKISPFGYLVSPALPAGLILNADGSITGTPTVATAATDYVVTATNTGGSSSYTLNFAIATIPTLTTTAASAVIATSATAGGTITDDGGASVTARGICWSTTSNPTISNSKTTDGTGIGIFESSITGLSPLSTYYVRAYATNSAGTAYGNELSFTTLASLVAYPVIFYNTPEVTYSSNSAIEPLVLYNTGGAVQSYSVIPALPVGLTLNVDGRITGTPTVATAATDYVVTATNSGGSSTYTISITVEDFVYTTLLATFSQNNVLCYGDATGTATALPSGGLTPYTYSWTNLDGPTNEVNEISTNATATGLSTGNYLCIIKDAITNSIQQEIFISEPLQISIRRSVINTSCVAGNDGSITLEVTNGTAPYTYSWSPSVSTSAIATGLAAGEYTYTVTDANGCVSVGSRNVRNPSTETYQDACGSYTWPVSGQTYTTSGIYTSVSNCNTVILYLTINPSTINPEASAQTFSGSPTVTDLVATGTNLQWYIAETGGSALAPTSALATGTYYVSQTLTSCESTRTSVAVTLALAGVPPVITYNASNTLTANSAITPLTVINTGGAVQSYSVSPALPAGLTLNEDGNITGIPTIATAATDYVVTATNNSGSGSYTFNLAVQDKPSVQTIDAIHILSNYAESGVTIINDNYSDITTMGVCWSTSTNPTIADNINATNDITQVYFTISGLSPSTTYYHRAFATNGLGTAYGNELSFTTLALTDAPPVITYNTFNTFTANSPIVSLTVTNTGGGVQSYSVSPDLPSDLVLNGDGSITGTPTVASAATDYVVTATNASGSYSYTLNIAITTALGVVKEMFSNAIVAYPNPYSDVFKIEAKTNSSDAITVSIYDMIAKKIESQKGTPSEIGTLQFGKDFPSGIYNVIIKQGSEVKILRVIKK